METADRRGGKNTLIAVGSRGLGQLQRFRMGSVSTKVIRAAEGPVPGQPRATTALNRELFREVSVGALFVWATVALGLLAAVTTVVQMVLLAKIVDEVF